jgi:hypothetical protein
VLTSTDGVNFGQADDIPEAVRSALYSYPCFKCFLCVFAPIVLPLITLFSPSLRAALYMVPGREKVLECSLNAL